MATGRSSSRSGGHDCDFVTSPPKSLECTICLLTVCQPMVVSCCGNHFCQQCIEKVQKHNKPCPLCNGVNFTTFLHKGVKREVNSLKVRCPHKDAFACPWEGDLGQLKDHVENKCRSLSVECTHKCGERFSRSEIRKHEQENCPQRPLELQMSSLVKKLESSYVDNQHLKDTLTKKLDRVIADNAALKLENSKLQTAMLADKDEITAARFEIQQLKQKFRSTASKLESSYASLEKGLTPMPPFFFTLDNLSYYMESAYTWTSPAFYTHPKGYKMRVTIETQSGPHRNHFSLQVGLLCGEFDENLSWPFNGNVTIEMLNYQKGSWGSQVTIWSTPGSEFQRGRPPTDGGYLNPWGIPRYMSHSQLEQTCGDWDKVDFKVVIVTF